MRVMVEKRKLEIIKLMDRLKKIKLLNSWVVYTMGAQSLCFDLLFNKNQKIGALKKMT